MLNKIILTGNVGRTPKIEMTQDGREIATFSLATNSSWKAYPRSRPREGGEHGEAGEPEQKTRTDWHKITVFPQATVEWIKWKLKKGDAVYVEGKLSYHPWVDKYGQPRSTPQIIVSNQEGRIEYLRSSKGEEERTSLIGDAYQRPPLKILTLPLESQEENSSSIQPCPQTTDFEDSSQQENN